MSRYSFSKSRWSVCANCIYKIKKTYLFNVTLICLPMASSNKERCSSLFFLNKSEHPILFKTPLFEMFRFSEVVTATWLNMRGFDLYLFEFLTAHPRAVEAHFIDLFRQPAQ